MLTKMRRRFTLAAMTAFGVVMLIVIIGINVAWDTQMRHSQDEMLDRIYEYDLLAADKPQRERPPINEMPWAGGPDREFVFRFFVVHCDKEGNVKAFSDEHISAIDEETAQSYAKKALREGSEKGYLEEYRYLIKEEGEEVALVFLNISEALDSKKDLLRVCALVGIGSLVAVFLLILVLSRPAIRPFVRNMQQQKQFITDAEHELKTPITSIATSADIAAMEYGESEWIRDIQKQAERLSSLTNELVQLSRLEEERPFPEKISFSLSDAAWEIVEPFETRAKASGKQFESRIEDEVSMSGDETSVQQLMSILLDNALRYSDEGGMIRFRVVRRYGGASCIEIFNTCTDIQRIEEPDRLFDRFYRPDPARNRLTGGSGLGLSIARMIVQRHGGTIDVSLEEEGAITFTAIFP